MIYRVVIINNGNQVSLTQQGNTTANFEIVGEDVWSDEVKEGMIDALNKLMEATNE